MLLEERYDFSQETDHKARLWEKMEHRMKQAASPRSEISLESISPISPRKEPERQNEMTPDEKNKGSMRR